MGHSLKGSEDVRSFFLPIPGKGEWVLRLRKKPGFRVLDGIAVALAGLLYLELHYAMAPPDIRASQSVWIASKTQYLQSRNFSTPQPTVSTLRDMMLSRPLFDPSRRPAAISAQAPTAPEEIPRLAGIMVTPTEKIAVFSPAMGAPIIVNQHSRFGPFTVLSISGDSVTIKGPDGVIVLGSDFSHRTEPEISTAKSTVLVDGIYLHLIKVALPEMINWQGPPLTH